MVRGDDTNRNIWIACIDKPTAILTVVLKFIFICLNYCLDRLLIFRNRCLLCWQTFCCCILRFSPNPIFTDKITIRGCGVGHHISVCSHIIPGTVCVLIPFIYQVGTIRVLYLPPPPHPASTLLHLLPSLEPSSWLLLLLKTAFFLIAFSCDPLSADSLRSCFCHFTEEIKNKALACVHTNTS